MFKVIKVNIFDEVRKRVKNELKIVQKRVENYFVLGVVHHPNSQILGYCRKE